MPLNARPATGGLCWRRSKRLHGRWRVSPDVRARRRISRRERWRTERGRRAEARRVGRGSESRRRAEAALLVGRHEPRGTKVGRGTRGAEAGRCRGSKRGGRTRRTEARRRTRGAEGWGRPRRAEIGRRARRTEGRWSPGLKSPGRAVPGRRPVIRRRRRGRAAKCRRRPDGRGAYSAKLIGRSRGRTATRTNHVHPSRNNRTRGNARHSGRCGDAEHTVVARPRIKNEVKEAVERGAPRWQPGTTWRRVGIHHPTVAPKGLQARPAGAFVAGRRAQTLAHTLGRRVSGRSHWGEGHGSGEANRRRQRRC
jgi:hypothetical protein